MRDRGNVRLGIKLAILIASLDVRVRPGLWLGHHVALALLEHGGSLSLVLAVLGHNLLELVVLVVDILNLLALRRNQEPLVHVHHVNVYERVILLETLGMLGRLVSGWEAPAEFHAELLILLGQVRSYERNARKNLSWDGHIVLLERTHIKLKDVFLLSKMTQELRQLHNDCKRKLILDCVEPGSRVLDCGCGRGGDLWKWKTVRAKVVAIDPCLESIREAEERAQNAKMDIWFLGLGDIRQAAFAGPYDVVCYNFSIHYIFADPDTFTESIRAIGVSVRPGGYLIGITPEKARAESMADENGRFTDTLGNEFELGQGTLRVRLSDGPFYADGPRDEPLLDGPTLIQNLERVGFTRLTWEPMLMRPNGLISDLYTKFVFRKKTR